MKLLCPIVFCGLSLLGMQFCSGMTAEQIVDQRMESRDLANYNAQEVIVLLDAFAVTMKTLSQAAITAAQDQAKDYGDDCCDGNVLKNMTRASMCAAHAHTKEFFEKIEILPQKIRKFLGQNIEDLRTALLGKEQCISIGQKLEALNKYDQFAQQLIENVKADLKNTELDLEG